MQNVLIIEDDPNTRILIQAVLRLRGFECEVVADGDAAIRTLRKNAYDAIVLDLLLPGVNGFEVLQFLRAEHREWLGKVVVLTGVDSATLRHFDGSGLHAVLGKPIDTRELADEVSDCAFLTRATPAAWASENARSRVRGRVH